MSLNRLVWIAGRNIPRSHPKCNSGGRIVRRILRYQKQSLYTGSRSYQSQAQIRDVPRDRYVQISEEIQAALELKKPVIALETAIYTHGKVSIHLPDAKQSNWGVGFPYPDNVALASHLESVVRINGGIPATIGVLNGVARVGLEPEELIELAASAGKPKTRKVSRRDLSHICGLGAINKNFNGGATVAGTMALAALAGIRVFATGGLGGVHRDRAGEVTLDISADLTELGRTNVAVFSSGCKSFLDLPRTLEYLETQGVFVGTFADGRTGEVDFPAFWTRDSGIRSPSTVSDETEAAAVIAAMTDIPVQSGLLFANPIPAEHSIEKTEMEAIISQAVQDAEKSGALGAANTPYVLSRIRDISNGRSVSANRALIEANAIRATKTAIILSEMILRRKEMSISDRKADVNRENKPEQRILDPVIRSDPSAWANENSGSVIVAGSVAIDLSCNYAPQKETAKQTQPQLYTSNPSLIRQTVGGVGHNLASAIHYLGAQVSLCSRVANDLAGSTILESLARRGLSTTGIQITNAGSRTAQYVAVNDANKNLVLAMADMEILGASQDGFHAPWQHQLDTQKPRWLIVDTNWDTPTLHQWLRAGNVAGAKIALEPVSVIKSKKIFDRSSMNDPIGMFPDNIISLATPNELELRAMFDAASSQGYFEREDWFNTIDAFGLSSSGSRPKLVSLTNGTLVDQGVPQQSIQLLPFIPCIMTTLGERGVLVTQLLRPGDVRLSSPESAPYIFSHSKNENQHVGGVYMRLLPPVSSVPKDAIASVNGAGDTFLGVMIAGLAKQNPKRIDELVDVAQKAAGLTLKTCESVSPDIEALKKFL